MKLNLGPAKGKDFGSSFGPWLVTKDELENYRQSSPDGDRYDLKMKASINGIQVSEDTLANMTWTFAQIIERVCYGVNIFPGDIIGSGTCGTGCFLELKGSKITQNQWLKPGDQTSKIGILQLKTNTTNFSILGIWNGILQIILYGFDHILFILGLFFFSHKLKPL